jgi:uncharacterized spore protein YtfJ
VSASDPSTPFPFSFVESLSNAGVRAVYGDPITVDSRTVIPVARVAYGFGGGNDADSGETGGGGGVVATPVGTLELTASETRFVPLRPSRRLLAAGVAGALAGYLLGRRH